MKLDAKGNAYRLVREALQDGTLVRPDECSGCGARPGRIDAHHHHGYEGARALDVQWLCTKCHHRAHVVLVPTLETNVRLQFLVPHEQARDFKVRCAQLETTMQMALQEALTSWLAKYPEEPG